MSSRLSDELAVALLKSLAGLSVFLQDVHKIDTPIDRRRRRRRWSTRCLCDTKICCDGDTKFANERLLLQIKVLTPFRSICCLLPMVSVIKGRQCVCRPICCAILLRIKWIVWFILPSTDGEKETQVAVYHKILSGKAIRLAPIDTNLWILSVNCYLLVNLKTAFFKKPIEITPTWESSNLYENVNLNLVKESLEAINSKQTL